MKYFLLFPILVLLSVSGDSQVVDKVIAKVNNENILKSEYDRLLNDTLEQFKLLTPKEQQTPERIRELKEEVLEKLINDKLLIQEAKKNKIQVTKRELEEGIKMVKSRFPSDEAFKLELKKANLTEKQFQENISNQIMVMKLVEEKVRKNISSPTESEVKEIFNKIIKIINKKDVKLSENEKEELHLLARLVEKYFDEQVRVRHILIRVDRDATKKEKELARNKIEEVRKKLLSGEDFVELAKVHSEDPGSKDRGGDLGFISRGDTVPEFEKVAFSLKEGEISGVVETEFGYHIIRVIERRKKRTPNYEEIKPDLTEYVYRKKIEQQYEEYINSLKKSAIIKRFPIHE